MKIKQTAALLILLFSSSVLYSQILRMQIDPVTAAERKNNMKKSNTTIGWKTSKLDILKNVTPAKVSQEVIGNYQIKPFIQFMRNEIFPKGDGVRIYFGAFTKIANTADPANQFVNAQNENVLVPIFVPTTAKGKNDIDVKNTAFIITPSGDKSFPLSTPALNTWIANYKTVVLKELAKELGFYNLTGETESLWYEKEDFSKLLIEIERQMQNPQPGQKPLTNFIVRTACFNFNEPSIEFYHRGKTVLNVSNQLTLVFEIPEMIPQTKEDKEKILYALWQKYSMLPQKNKPSFFMPDGLYDTGVPCPPENNCVGDDGRPLPAVKAVKRK